MMVSMSFIYFCRLNKFLQRCLMQSPDVFEIFDSLLVVDKPLNRSRFCYLHTFKGFCG
jgi:hypothetical protein